MRFETIQVFRILKGDPLVMRAAALCRAVAPADLRGVPVYVMRKSLLPAGLGGDGRNSGETSPYLDLGLRDAIGDRWRGRGPAVIADDRHGAVFFLSIVAHELSHVLSWDRPFIEPSYHSPEQARAIVAEGLRERAGPPDEWYPLAVALDTHGPQFFRIALHVGHRAAEAGFMLDGESVIGHGFDHSPFTAYVAALGDEPARMARLPFSAIRATPTPHALVALWEADAARSRPIPG